MIVAIPGRIIAATLIGLLAGCSMAPAYRVPATPAVASFKEAQGWAAAAPMDDLPRGPWWRAFGDPALDDLEERAEAASPTIAAAVARYRQAAAVADRAGAERLPIITANGDISRERVSDDRPLARGNGGTYTDKLIGGAFDWEIDLWGRLLNAARAGRADAIASNADLASARLSLHASIADTYFRLRGFDAQAELLRQTVAAFTRAAELTNTRHDGGIASGLDVSRARTLLSDAKAQISVVALDRANAEHALAVLVGETPSAFNLVPLVADLAPLAIPAGAPALLLQRRPDIAASERRMAAANARIGVARAAWFPAVTLGFQGGFQATGGSLLAASNSFWALGPLALAGTIFDGGRRAADVRRSRAAFDETAANYRATVLTAFREVEDSLAAARHLARAAADQGDASRAAARTRDLALTRYRDGASDYLEVVIAQTAALDSQRSAIALQTQRVQASVSLILALGGGFTAADLATTPSRSAAAPTG